MLLLIFVDNIATTALFSNLKVVSSILDFFSTQSRFNVFSQGLFRLTDIIFYLSVTIVFVLWTIIVLERRRWSRG
jgi:ABC-2 type transport system permease protein